MLPGHKCTSATGVGELSLQTAPPLMKCVPTARQLSIVVRIVYIMTSFPPPNVPKMPLIGFQTRKKQTFVSFLSHSGWKFSKKTWKSTKPGPFGRLSGKKPSKSNYLTLLSLNYEGS
jgi:hypothetical protein